ncbi:MAG TPA: tryptophan synthase subunit alpha [Fibrobacteria bacterium]|nr:tryptophan synthase subunit alpha [Fibrobacteria bacterium]
MLDRFQARFGAKLAKGQKLFVAYIGAGVPGLDESVQVALELSRLGVDCIEFGLPFSDPYGDGSVNQAAAEEGLRQGVTVGVYFELIRKIRAKTDIPLVAFGYSNPVWKFGVDRFAQEAAQAGIDAMLLVDIPVEESDELDAACSRYGLANTFLTAPTTPHKRLEAIAARARGFVYHVSRTGVTGEQSTLSASLGDEVRVVKSMVSPPVVVGFGINTPDQVREVCRVADGAVVGSAIVRRTLQAKLLPDMLQDIGQLVGPLVEATR